MMIDYVLAIDPSCKESAFCVIDYPTLKPVCFGFMSEERILDYVEGLGNVGNSALALEGFENSGMVVGKSVFDTCMLVGKLLERANRSSYNDVRIIYRKEEKKNLCNKTKANDTMIVHALVDRFAEDKNNLGKGTKQNKGWFYGFKKDIWQAYAIGITYCDRYLRR